MSVGRTRHLLSALHECAQARIACCVDPQHERVQEASDERVERGIGASRNRSANRHVGALAKSRQQSRQGRIRHHEQARLQLARDSEKTRVHGGVDAERHAAASIADDHRAMVDGKRELLRQVGEGASPVRQLPAHLTRRIGLHAEHRALPERVIRVLHRQRVPARRDSFAPRCIGRTQIAPQRPHRPTVARDVMEHHQQHVLVRCQPIQLHAQRPLRCQLKRPCDVRGQPRWQCGFVDIDRAHRDRVGR